MARTIARCLTRAAELADSASARLDTEVLLAAALARPRSYLYGFAEYELTPAEAERFESWFERRRRGEPVAYIVGQRSFWTLELAVSPAVLIPRPATETLVELAVAALPPGGRLLDLGTGSGAIALAVAVTRPDCQATGVDIDPAALALAEANARAAGVNVQWLRSDWFAAVTGTFDVIVSNPPYLAADDPHLQQGDVRFEPRTALVSGPSGLESLATLVAAARAHLGGGGWLWLEHGAQQADAVAALLTDAGYAEVATHPDLDGHPRVTGGRRP